VLADELIVGDVVVEGANEITLLYCLVGAPEAGGRLTTSEDPSSELPQDRADADQDATTRR
jgi:hypothetical protein